MFVTSHYHAISGESLAQVLCLAGVRPIADSIGRVNKLELIPLEELGRPRVDVVVSCSGVFRDLFINQMNLLDRGVSCRYIFHIFVFYIRRPFIRLLSLVRGGAILQEMLHWRPATLNAPEGFYSRPHPPLACLQS